MTCGACGLVLPMIVLGMSWGGTIPNPTRRATPTARASWRSGQHSRQDRFFGDHRVVRTARRTRGGPRRRDLLDVPTAERPSDPDRMRRVLVRDDTALHFNGPGNE